MNFINTSSSPRSSADQQRRAHSHAARVAHARTRKRQTLDYQATRDEDLATKNTIESSTTGRDDDGVAVWDLILRHVSDMDLQPSPVSLISSYQTDPFKSAIVPLTKNEQFMFNYCGFSSLDIQMGSYPSIA
jgi:hypothetical protein